MDSPEALQALISVIQGSLTQMGIPAVFLIAWYMTWRAYTKEVADHLRDLRRAAGLTLPEDVLRTSSPLIGGD